MGSPIPVERLETMGVGHRPLTDPMGRATASGLRVRVPLGPWSGRCAAIVLVVASLWIGSLALVPLRLAFMPAETIEEIDRALSLASGSPALHMARARALHGMLQAPDPQGAWQEYRTALLAAPLDPGGWLSIARLYQDVGPESQAQRARVMAWDLAPNDPGIRWALAMEELRSGEPANAIPHIRAVIAVDPRRREAALALGRRLLRTREWLMELIPDLQEPLQEALVQLQEGGDLPNVRLAWERLSALGPVDPGLTTSYVEFLLRQKESAEARRVWVRTFDGAADEKGTSDAVWNGGFEVEPVWGGGLAWHRERRPQSKVELDSRVAKSGARAVRLEFRGRSDVDVVPLWQLVPVRQNSPYVLQVWMRTRGLTTTSGPRIEVLDAESKAVLAMTVGLTGSSDWVRLSADFRTPPGVSLLLLRLRRAPSLFPEEHLRGFAWVDEVSLRPL